MIELTKKDDSKREGAPTQIARLIALYHKLVNGEPLNKEDFIKENQITERTFARDIADIRLFLSEIFSCSELLYDKRKNEYYLTGYTKSKFSGTDIIAILKILLESRAFEPEKLHQILNTIIRATPVYEQSALMAMVEDELKNYIPLKSRTSIFENVWELERLILRKEKITISYTKANGDEVIRTVIPLSVVFSEYYFYLVALMESPKYSSPIFYRVDRISSFSSLGKYEDPSIYKLYDVAELKNKVQFMQSGEAMTIKFKFWGDSLDAVLDKLPTAKVVGHDGKKAIVEAEVFGRGIKMWLLSQAEFLEVIEPQNFRDEMKETIDNMVSLYTTH